MAADHKRSESHCSEKNSKIVTECIKEVKKNITQHREEVHHDIINGKIQNMSKLVY